jgi:uncharacterized membrane protein
MPKSRLEAFSDGVIAILITIMVLSLKSPQGASLSALENDALRSTFLSYVLSFVYLGIYWNNHHHMLHMTQRVSGAILWANLHLLFWLSLVPFVTAWCGETGFAATPTACYGVVLVSCAIAYTVLQATIVRDQGPESPLKAAIGGDRKGKLSIGLYVAAIALAPVARWASVAIYVAVAVIWLVPDSRIESRFRDG